MYYVIKYTIQVCNSTEIFLSCWTCWYMTFIINTSDHEYGQSHRCQGTQLTKRKVVDAISLDSVPTSIFIFMSNTEQIVVSGSTYTQDENCQKINCYFL